MFVLDRQPTSKYHFLFNTQEDLDTMYDHANTGTVAGTYGTTNQKVFQLYTQLNGARIQNINLDSTPAGPFTDYMQHRRQIRNSILNHLNVFQHNWYHCDDWTSFGHKYDEDNNIELISGIPISVSPLTWSFVGVQMRNLLGANTFQHYTWFVFVRGCQSD